MGNINKDVLKEIKSVNVLTDRVKNRLKIWEESKATVSADNSVWFTEEWNRLEGLPKDLRWAKTFAYRMDKSEPIIREGELIVGSSTKYVKGVDIITAMKPVQVYEMMKESKLESRLRAGEAAGISEEDGKLLMQDAEYWVNHMPPDYINKLLVEELGEDHLWLLADRAMVFEGLFERAEPERGIFEGFSFWLGQPTPTAHILNSGLQAVIDRAQVELDKMDKEGGPLSDNLNGAYHKRVLMRAIIVQCEAIIRWAHRHAELARELAEKEADETRKQELLQIAEHCDRVPAYPPRTYWEAMQSLRFLHLAIKKEQPERPEDIGRLDQMLYPYYKKDVDAGRLTRQFAAELLGCMWLKIREGETLEGLKEGLRITPGSLLPHVTVGGRDAEGNDQINEVSWIILQVAQQMQLAEPSVYIRYHEDIDPEYVIAALEANCILGGGNPCFLSDELGTKRFVNRGVSKEDASDWAATGCLVYRMTSDEVDGVGSHLNMAKIMEITLHNGYDPRTKRQLGPKTGDVTEFDNIEQFYQAFFAQLDYFVERQRKDFFIRRSVDREHAVNSGYAAVLLGDTVFEKGLGVHEGGSKNAIVNSVLKVGDRGTTDVADCMAAIKYLVFDEKKLSMADLMEAMDSEWAGKEEIRKLCLSAPKYGNDDDYVDDIYQYISGKSQEIMQSRPCPVTGLKPFLAKGAGAGHIVEGMVVGALPNGRLPRTSLNDGATSAMPGVDVNGPTALINSAIKLTNKSDVYAGVHNMKLRKELLNSREKLEKVAALIKTYFYKGGWHIQFNIHDEKELLDAQEHPADHKNLVVRVAGYSAFFVDLPPMLQNEIIGRTKHVV